MLIDSELKMKSMYSQLQHQVPVRARIAFVLSIADRVMPALGRNAEALNAARKALTYGWRWEEGENLRALQLYDDNVERLAVEGSLVKDAEASAAMCAATSAFYYTLWHAFRQDLIAGQVRKGDIYNDIEEVSELVINEVCHYAVATSLCNAMWIDSLRKRLVSDFHSDNPEELGPAIPRQYFTK